MSLRLFWALFFTLLLSVGVCSAKNITANFNSEIVGTVAKSFESVAGIWHIDEDANNIVYAVDGRKWMSGMESDGIIGEARRLYSEFLGNPTFPLSIYRGIKRFVNGTIYVKFKAISGRIDQGAGIAFDIKPNGDYMVIRANPLENNIIAFKIEKGNRSTVQETGDIPLESKKWYVLKVVIKGDRVEGYLNNKRYINFKFKNKTDGRIGLWSKSDSYVLFDDFTVESN